jgi:hypothetical protein
LRGLSSEAGVFVLFQKRRAWIVVVYSLFFSRKEPKALALRGFKNNRFFCGAEQMLFFSRKEPKRYLCEASKIKQFL